MVVGFFSFGSVSEYFQCFGEEFFFLLPLGELLLVALLGFFGGALGFEVGEETPGWIMAWIAILGLDLIYGFWK